MNCFCFLNSVGYLPFLCFILYLGWRVTSSGDCVPRQGYPGETGEPGAKTWGTSAPHTWYLTHFPNSNQEIIFCFSFYSSAPPLRARTHTHRHAHAIYSHSHSPKIVSFLRIGIMSSLSRFLELCNVCWQSVFSTLWMRNFPSFTFF